MKRLILTSSSGLDIARSGLAEVVIPFFFRFVWGPLPPPKKLAAYFAARSDVQGPGDHWSDWVTHWPSSVKNRKNVAFADLCQAYETIELWFDASPDDQLHLIWLLDQFRSHSELLPKFKLRLIAFGLTVERAESLAKSEPHVPLVNVAASEIETASRAWQAYCAPTPEACFDLIRNDLSALPMLKPALLDLLAELPSPSSGLGATEMRFLELIARGFTHTNALFHLRSLRRTYVFEEFELGWLLQGLALGPKPAVAGLDEELRTISQENLRARHAAYLRSQLSLTDFGKAVLAGEEDFSRHNPIDRWWGGTHFTNDRLWRCGLTLTRP